ncbi:type I-E CRISPR-associated protein Cse2/CasB [Streptomyces sp. SAJ15]|uniref:type I-E CRISPR-associated protein Cse2/CasB n=1 Tax=Streptomyces sp. SAJ15 TaxID=2011095 RepID=UPI0011862499|nr:type I-E CRISPR-associated protein Cse2/CasB [Streptomyces sp. SAJ15]TVL91596.1 type I-E CRISPR-associated protein Cse2/CasB [Streptomyces sp. SAJ15]
MTTSTQSSEGAGRPTGGRRSWSLARRATASCLKRLQGGYLTDNAAAVATVARLRRSVGRLVHDSPTTWGIDDGLDDLIRLRDQQAAKAAQEEQTAPFPLNETQLQAEEQAVHLAVTLWALHQQSIRDAGMCETGWPLGRAVRRLTAPVSGSGNSGARLEDEQNETLRKRFVRIGTATSFESLGTRLREMVLLLRTARIPLDYGLLADQLVSWQTETRRTEVRREWGREFHLAYSEERDTTS